MEEAKTTQLPDWRWPKEKKTGIIGLSPNSDPQSSTDSFEKAVTSYTQVAHNNISHTSTK